jgi:hypothetical protein
MSSSKARLERNTQIEHTKERVAVSRGAVGRIGLPEHRALAAEDADEVGLERLRGRTGLDCSRM